MRIDEVIEFSEKQEQKDREIGFADPDGFGWSFLPNLYEKSMQADNEFRLKVWLMERRISNLVLLVRRLRDELNLPQREGSSETKNKHYIEIDIDAFLHFSYLILNIVARFTPRFYKDVEREGLKNKGFNDQKRWFLKHPEIDKAYSEYLGTKTFWFEEMEKDRSALSHHHPLIAFRSSKYVLAFGTHRKHSRADKNGFIPNYPILDYVNEKSSGLLEFIQFYDEHFGKQS